MTNSVDGYSNFSRHLTNFYKFVAVIFFGGFSAVTKIRRIRIYGGGYGVRPEARQNYQTLQYRPINLSCIIFTNLSFGAIQLRCSCVILSWLSLPRYSSVNIVYFGFHRCCSVNVMKPDIDKNLIHSRYLGNDQIVDRRNVFTADLHSWLIGTIFGDWNKARTTSDIPRASSFIHDCNTRYWYGNSVLRSVRPFVLCWHCVKTAERIPSMFYTSPDSHIF